MLRSLARRLGFEPTVPVAGLDDWVLPEPDPDLKPPITLAPRAGAAALVVDSRARIQPAGGRWVAEPMFAAGSRWVSAIESTRFEQRLVTPSVVETTFGTPAGTVVHRVGAGVVGGRPAGIVEIENQGGVAIAVGLVIRPLTLDDRGFLPAVTLDRSGIACLDVSGSQAGGVIFDRAPVAGLVSVGSDLVAEMPEATGGLVVGRVESRAGLAQAAVVWPLAHTATLRYAIDLGAHPDLGIDATRDTQPVLDPDAGTVDDTGPVLGPAIPGLDDVQRGWGHHLAQGLRVAVGTTPVGGNLAAAQRTLLSSWPPPDAVVAAATALAFSGFPPDVARLVPTLEVVDDPSLLVAVAAWLHAAEPTEYLDQLDRLLGPVARQIHDAGRAGMRGPAWLSPAFDSLADRLRLIEQPDVAAALEAVAVEVLPPESGDAERVIAASRDPLTLVDSASAARYTLAVRSLVIAERRDRLDLLPWVPDAWRGETIDVFGARVAGGTISFGIRWHGPRPALLWQLDRADHAPMPTISVPGIDPTFETNEPTGETLLADPGWPRP